MKKENKKNDYTGINRTKIRKRIEAKTKSLYHSHEATRYKGSERDLRMLYCYHKFVNKLQGKSYVCEDRKLSEKSKLKT